MHAAPGTRLGPYEIVKPLGAGGMGEVYEARDTRLDRLVAIKVLPAEMARDAGARARFDREARAIAAINHPNICALHDIGDADGHGFLVMERLEGETLQERLQRGPLDLAQIVDFGIALADALDAAHARGLIHRDLKPANIFVTTRGIIKILDFGLVKSVEGDPDITRSAGDALTAAGSTFGTVAYMSPEQLRAEPLDVRTDLFSLGLVLYEMATGQRAFAGSTSAVVAAGILHQQPPAPRTLRDELPVRLEETILKALEKDRALRSQSAAELRADLARAKRDGGSDVRIAEVPPPPPAALAETTTPRRSPPPRRRVMFAVVLLLALVSAASWFQQRQSRGPSPADEDTLPSLRRGDFGPSPRGRGPDPSGTRDGSPPPDAAGRGQFDGERRPPPGPPPDPGRGNPPELVTPPDVPFVAPPPGEPPDTRNPRPRAARGFGPGSATLAKILRSAPPENFDLVFAAGDTEAMTMADQIRTVLTTGGWTHMSSTEIAEPQVRLGIFAPRATPGVTALRNWAVRSELNPDFRRMPSLKNVRIVIGRQQQR